MRAGVADIKRLSGESLTFQGAWSSGFVPFTQSDSLPWTLDGARHCRQD